MNPIVYDRSDLGMIPGRRKDANKGTYKRVLIVAGSCGMCGAAFLSALSAYRTGAGLVYILTVSENRQILQTLLPEAIVYTYDPEEVMNPDSVWTEKLDDIVSKKDIIVAGPGRGTEEYAAALLAQIFEKSGVPMIVDADALNIIAERPDLASALGEDTIVTPHPGEMSRLTGLTTAEIGATRIQTACDFAEQYGVTCVLKGYETVTVTNEGQVYVNKSGSPALAKGGSGDVLTGIIAGLMCLGLDPQTAAPLGVYVHGLAGEAAAKKFGEHGVLARDVADAVCDVMK